MLINNLLIEFYCINIYSYVCSFIEILRFFPFLRTKLNYNPPKDDGSTYKIELEGISVMVMREILDYIFSGQV